MPIAAICPECKHAKQIADKYIGQWLRCPKCQTKFQVGTPDEAHPQALTVTANDRSPRRWMVAIGLFLATATSLTLGTWYFASGLFQPRQTASATAKSGLVAGGQERTLTEEQRIRWNKLRRTQLQGMFVVGFRVADNQWLFSHSITSGEDYLIVWKTIAQRGGYVPFTTAFAKQMAAGAPVEMKASAVVDLVTYESPKIMCWYYRDGNAMKELTEAPTQELLRSLDQFLWDTQTFAYEDGKK